MDGLIKKNLNEGVNDVPETGMLLIPIIISLVINTYPLKCGIKKIIKNGLKIVKYNNLTTKMQALERLINENKKKLGDKIQVLGLIIHDTSFRKTY